MQMLNQKQLIKKNKIKKSHILLFGSLLVFVGVFVLTGNHLLMLRNSVFSDMQILISDATKEPVEEKEEVIEEVPVANDVVESPQPSEPAQTYTINYDKYLGVLEIPKIGLKRGFYGLDSKYNNIQYNVTLVSGSTMPDVVNGNLILIAHSGDAYISFFAYLYKLNIGDDIFVTYGGNKYQYKLVNKYNVDKVGTVKIARNYEKTTLTLITCTKNDDYHQTVYISEMI